MANLWEQDLVDTPTIETPKVSTSNLWEKDLVEPMVTSGNLWEQDLIEPEKEPQPVDKNQEFLQSFSDKRKQYTSESLPLYQETYLNRLNKQGLTGAEDIKKAGEQALKSSMLEADDRAWKEAVEEGAKMGLGGNIVDRLKKIASDMSMGTAKRIISTKDPLQVYFETIPDDIKKDVLAQVGGKEEGGITKGTIKKWQERLNIASTIGTSLVPLSIINKLTNIGKLKTLTSLPAQMVKGGATFAGFTAAQEALDPEQKVDLTNIAESAFLGSIMPLANIVPGIGKIQEATTGAKIAGKAAGQAGAITLTALATSYIKEKLKGRNPWEIPEEERNDIFLNAGILGGFHLLGSAKMAEEAGNARLKLEEYKKSEQMGIEGKEAAEKGFGVGLTREQKIQPVPENVTSLFDKPIEPVNEKLKDQKIPGTSLKNQEKTSWFISIIVELKKLQENSNNIIHKYETEHNKPNKNIKLMRQLMLDYENIEETISNRKTLINNIEMENPVLREFRQKIEKKLEQVNFVGTKLVTEPETNIPLEPEIISEKPIEKPLIEPGKEEEYISGLESEKVAEANKANIEGLKPTPKEIKGIESAVSETEKKSEEIKTGGGFSDVEPVVSPMSLEKLPEGLPPVKETKPIYHTDTPQKPISEYTPIEKQQYYKRVLEENKKNTWFKRTVKGIKDILPTKGGAERTFGIISTGLYKIDPRLKYGLARKHVYDISKETQNYKQDIEGFLKEKREKLSKEEDIIYDAAEKAGDEETISALNQKYGLSELYTKKRNVLDELAKRLKEQGVDFGLLENFSPRGIMDREAVRNALNESGQMNSAQEILIKKQDEMNDRLVAKGEQPRPMTQSEQDMVLNNFLRGYEEKIDLAKPGKLKERKLPVVPPELIKHYSSSDQATLAYIDSITKYLNVRKLFGKDAVVNEDGSLEVEQSAGNYINRLLKEGKIKEKDVNRIKDAITALVKPNEMTSKFLSLYRDVEYMVNMASGITSTLTQGTDIGFAFGRFGIGSALKSLIPQKISTKLGATKWVEKPSDIYLSDREIAVEFTNPSKSAKALAKAFFATGIAGMDKLARIKNINASLFYYENYAKKNPLKLKQKLNEIFTDPNELDGVIKDLQQGRLSENVKFLAFNKILDIQPIKESEVPINYRRGGNEKILYTLKLYTLKQWDNYRQIALEDIKRGDVAVGIKKMAVLTGTLQALGIGIGALRNFTLGRYDDVRDMVEDLPDLSIASALGIVGIPRYLLYVARKEGLSSAAMKLFLPPFKFIDSTVKDIFGIASGKIKTIKDLNSIMLLPMFGKHLYWILGSGKKATEKYNAIQTQYRELNKDIKETVKEEPKDFKIRQLSIKMKLDKSAIDKKKKSIKILEKRKFNQNAVEIQKQKLKDMIYNYNQKYEDKLD